MNISPADHCTSWPDRIGSWDWSTCCLAHDVAYEMQLPKLAADIELAQCVAGVAIGILPAAIGGVMGLGVMLFGGKYYRKARQ